MNIFLIIVSILIADLAITALIFSLAGRGKKKALGKLSAFMTGALARSIIPSFNGEYQGMKFTVSLSAGNKTGQKFLNVSFLKTSSFNLRIYKENALTLWAEKIGIVRELKVGEEGFDKEFLIFGDKKNEVMNFLRNRSVQEEIRFLFQQGYNWLFISRKKVLIKKPEYNLDYDLEQARIKDVIQKLSLLARWC